MKQKEIIKKVNVIELDKWYKKIVYIIGWVTITWVLFWFVVGFMIGLGVI